MVVNNFKKLLEQSKSLEEEVLVTRSVVNQSSVNKQSIVNQDSDLMAMSLTCSALNEDDLEMKDLGKQIKVNLNYDGKAMPSIGDCLLFIKGKDQKFLAFGFNKVELDKRTI